MPPFEDLPQEEDPIDTFSSLYRIVAELGFVSAIFVGVCIQRNEINYGINHDSSTAANVAKFAVILARPAGFGGSIRCLYDDSFLALKHNLFKTTYSEKKTEKASSSSRIRVCRVMSNAYGVSQSIGKSSSSARCFLASGICLSLKICTTLTAPELVVMLC